MPRPLAIAHRGASGYEFENSRAAFRRAVLFDVDGVELDVHATRDGALVVHHDAVVPGVGTIGDLALADLAAHRLPNGEPLPLLPEVLELFGDRDVWVEVKTLPAAHDAALFACLDAGPHPARYAVHAFDHRIIHRLKRARPGLATGALLASYPLDAAAVLRETGASTLWMEWHLIDADLVAAVHGAGARLVAWTVNDIGALAELARLGVDGLCGNYPDRIRVAVSGR